MSYSTLPSSGSSSSIGSTFPPVYDDLEAGVIFKNFVHRSTKNHLITTINVDTNLPAATGRFSNIYEQNAAPNVLLKAQFMNATVRLQGKERARIEMSGRSAHRRVLRIVQPQQGDQTVFDVNLDGQGRNAIVVLPLSFSGMLHGRVTLSPLISKRSTCLLQDEDDNKTRHMVAPPLVVHKEAHSSGQGETELSSVSNSTKTYGNSAGNGKCYICFEEEYMLEHSEAVRKEGEKAVQLENAYWPLRLCDYWIRIYAYDNGCTIRDILECMVAIVALLLVVLIMYFIVSFLLSAISR